VPILSIPPWDTSKPGEAYVWDPPGILYPTAGLKRFRRAMRRHRLRAERMGDQSQATMFLLMARREDPFRDVAWLRESATLFRSIKRPRWAWFYERAADAVGKLRAAQATGVVEPTHA
jgi:hypothetical protein